MCNYPPTLTGPTNAFYAAVNQLPAKKMWSVMERIRTVNACHLFLAIHPDRAKASYRIDFTRHNALDYTPLFRLRSGVIGEEIVRPGWHIRLNPTCLALAQHIDGKRSIREITSQTFQRGLALDTHLAGLENLATNLI